MNNEELLDRVILAECTNCISDNMKKYIDEIEREDFSIDKLRDDDFYDLLTEYEEYKREYNSLKRLVAELEIVIRQRRYLLAEAYIEEGIKSVKAREDKAREEYSYVEMLLSRIREIRDESYLRSKVVKYLIEGV